MYSIYRFFKGSKPLTKNHYPQDDCAMEALDKKELSERDICKKFITPAIKRAKWDDHTQILEEVRLTSSRIIVKDSTNTGKEALPEDGILEQRLMSYCSLIEKQDT